MEDSIIVTNWLTKRFGFNIIVKNIINYTAMMFLTSSGKPYSWV